MEYKRALVKMPHLLSLQVSTVLMLLLVERTIKAESKETTCITLDQILETLIRCYFRYKSVVYSINITAFASSCIALKEN
jgi:hypothetical protein